jgi:hypothetical protein
MSKSVRFLIGFLLGLFLTGTGFSLAGIGHGTYAPMICNVGVLGLIFLPLILFLAPFQWGLYFVLIPAITSSRWRTLCIVAVIITHLVPGYWVAATDPAFARAMNQDLSALLVYSVSLLVTLATFVFIGLRGTNRRGN